MKKSLLAGLDVPDLRQAPDEPAAAGLFVPLDQIQADVDQPRRMTDSADEALKLLADSILQHGILQPITVQRLSAGGPAIYQIIAGERRWRAALQAAASGQKCQRKGYDLSRIPVYIRDPENETDKLEMQMVENLARADMSDTDIGIALNRLLQDTGTSKAELARRLGRSDTWVKAVLAKSSPEALAVSERIGVPVESLGAGESMRLISWSKDAEKSAVLDTIAAEIRGGRAYSRSLIDEAETQYEICRRFPKLAGRQDLSLDDLQTWQGMWSSPDEGQRAVAERVLEGMRLADAMRAPVEVVQVEASEDVPEYSSVPPIHAQDEFDIDADEAEDAAAARIAVRPAPAAFTPEDRVSVDTAGMQMEMDRGAAPVAALGNPDIHVRVPGDLVKMLLEKAGQMDDLTVDADAVLRAIRSLV